ncbi:MAG: neutral/alkaline ceramidase [Mycobacteriaceae bacterium]|nr:neutral/alkaline ceramidase [Mycobacteriaceae bacterium]
MVVSRRSVLAGVVGAAWVGGVGGGATGAAGADVGGEYLVGCGLADMTGAVAGQGMMGYSEPKQVAEGLLMRCHARAYIVVDRATGNRVAFVTADVACLFQSVHQGVMAELARRFGGLYTERNVNLNATHTHASCGGTAWDFAYSLAAYGFKQNSWRAEVDGIVAAISQAHQRLAPGAVTLGRGELHDASANRSRVAFEANPAADKAAFPNAIDPAVTVLRFRQGGADIGAITWFSTHGTSLTDKNTLIAGDNKGFASYRWEHDEKGVRHLDGPAAFVAAFPQTNAGDMTPNLNVAPLHPSGPTDNPRVNCAVIGDRQYRAGRAAFAYDRPMSRHGVDAVLRYVDMSAVTVAGAYTPDGRTAHTSPAMMGAGAVATSMEDNFEQPLPLFTEGARIPDVPDWVRDVQSPKLIAAPLGIMPGGPWIPQVLPIQLLRIGDLVLAAGPAEFTVVAGLRIRRTVAKALNVPLENVLLQGYSNAYSQYVTTPEEYAQQQYEGGETMFGRWTLCAYQQEFDRLAKALAAQVDLGRGPAPLDRSAFQPDLAPAPPADTPLDGRRFGDVLTQPAATCRAGQTVAASFVGAHPHNNLRLGGTYLEIQRHVGGRWRREFDDNDWCTEFGWARVGASGSRVRVSWTVPQGVPLGRYRIHYLGDSKDAAGRVTPFTGTSGEFAVT